jgi:XTP/dITP diphosphohydrolase
MVLATRNRDKVRELGRMLTGVGIEIVGLDDVAPGSDELHEDEDSFVGNALSKARQAVALTGLPALADDSGLEVDALDGAPGIWSARFAGAHGDYQANNALLLARMSEVPDELRTARFRCVVALVDPESGLERTFEGTCEGVIARAPRGRGGFGYDPLFLLPDRGRTVAELPPAEKDAISHRGRAVRRLIEFLEG